jgi:hypothetical protein
MNRHDVPIGVHFTRSVQSGVFSQDGSVRSVQSGLFSQECSVRRVQSGVFSQEGSLGHKH